MTILSSFVLSRLILIENSDLLAAYMYNNAHSSTTHGTNLRHIDLVYYEGTDNKKQQDNFKITIINY